ncbi:MAG: hypothetical protein WC758_02810 [Candidatus Woesearchaeota archaeon]|jgi:hypothetical protein
MRPIKDFEEYIEEQIVKEQSPDKSRANSLKKESEQAEKFLKKIINTIGITDENANIIIKITYDIIMAKIRAKMILKGYNASGSGAHEAEVAYLRKLNFNEKDLQFCDQLRYFRNGIMYYGKSFDKEYAKKTISFLEKFK